MVLRQLQFDAIPYGPVFVWCYTAPYRRLALHLADSYSNFETVSAILWGLVVHLKDSYAFGATPYDTRGRATFAFVWRYTVAILSCLPNSDTTQEVAPCLYGSAPATV